MGIVTRVCEEPFKEALALAADIAQKSPDAVAAAKRLYNKTYALRDREVRARRAPLCHAHLRTSPFGSLSGGWQLGRSST